MFELKIAGKDFEEFKLNLKIACQNILIDSVEDVSLVKGPIKVEVPTTIIKENKDESKKRQKRRKEEVITSPLPLGEEVNNSPITQELVIEDEEEDDLIEMSAEEIEAFEEGEREKEEWIRKASEVDTTDYSKIELTPLDQLTGKPKKIKLEHKSHPTKMEYFAPTEVKDLIMQVYQKAGKGVADKILKNYGVTRVHQLSEKNYQLVATECLEYLAVIDANASRETISK